MKNREKFINNLIEITPLVSLNEAILFSKEQLVELKKERRVILNNFGLHAKKIKDERIALMYLNIKLNHFMFDNKIRNLYKLYIRN